MRKIPFILTCSWSWRGTSKRNLTKVIRLVVNYPLLSIRNLIPHYNFLTFPHLPELQVKNQYPITPISTLPPPFTQNSLNKRSGLQSPVVPLNSPLHVSISHNSFPSMDTQSITYTHNIPRLSKKKGYVWKDGCQIIIPMFQNNLTRKKKQPYKFFPVSFYLLFTFLSAFQ